MTTTAELLTTLNAYRLSTGGKPLKAWKESRAKLDAAVASIPSDWVMPDTDTERGSPAEAAPAGDVPPPPPESPAGPVIEIADPKPVKRQPKRGDATRLTDIARANGKSEKVMRAKARRWQSKLRQYTVNPQVEDWTFWNKDLEAVCKILGVAPPVMCDNEPTSAQE